jgi:mannose-6-phosphate isomerase
LTDESTVAQPLKQRLLPLRPRYQERVWGGHRLHPGIEPIGEAWIAFGESEVARGRLAGRSLDVLRARHGAELLGDVVAERFPDRWPLLIKLLDVADWLSIQVHPNDEQARRIAGPGQWGKTEAWYFLDVVREGRILLGVKRGVSSIELGRAIREGRAADVAEAVPVRRGEGVLIPAGTLHALGPGLLVYEVQQQSDITYRAYDWDRPEYEGRSLHLEEAVAVTVPVGPQPLHTPAAPPDGLADAISCPLFRLELGRAGEATLPLNTGGHSFHALTVIEGSLRVAAGSEKVRLARFETVLVAGGVGPYTVVPVGGPAAFLRSSVPS